MRFATFCTGIDAPAVAWGPLGWRSAWSSEIEKFPSAVLAHHYPGVPNVGDMAAANGKDLVDSYGAVDVLIAGTPCQSFSVMGKRAGLDDARGNLAFEYLRICGEAQPRWLIWENVPGVLSSNGGEDFGAILGALGECGYMCAWRVLDAGYFGCACPRKRLFLVGYLGDWRRAAAALYEPESAHRDPAARWRGTQFRLGPYTITRHNAGARHGRGNIIDDVRGWRGMTPIECERAMGFPDDYTKIPWDGNLIEGRYCAIGNSMAVPVVRWIGERIAAVDAIPSTPTLNIPSAHI